VLSKRKVTIAGLLVLMLCGIFVGVVQAQEKVELTMSVWGMPWEDKLYTDFAIPQFEAKYPHIKVNFVRFEDYWNQLLIRHAGGNAPDVMRNADEDFGQMRMRGALHPLTSYVEASNLDLSDFHDIAIDALTVDGELWALPQDLSPRNLLYYNKAMFDEAGISYPTADWTLEDLVDAAKKLTKGSRPRVQQWGITWSEAHFLSTAMLGFGGELWDENGRSVVAGEGNVAGIEWIQSLVFEHGVAPNYLEVDPGNTLDLFKGERSAMHINGGWSVPAVARDVPDLDFGVVPLPKPLSTVLGQCIWTMSSQTEYPDEAWLLIEFLSSYDVLREYWQLTWVAAPARLSVIFSDDFSKITGVEGHVPAITDPQRLQDLTGFWDVLIGDDRFTQDHVHPYYGVLKNTFLEPYSDELFGATPADAAAILQTIQDGVNSEIDAF